ncbi:MAG: hypothetical protein HYV97_09860 [Bdellovibrio sp.]|nr:hypothetical protein [Bdellovibrio sp.]
MKSNHPIFSLLLCLFLLGTSVAPQMAYAETRNAEGRPRIATYIELKVTIGTVQKLIYLEALSLMGDVGEGGGGIRKWEREFQSSYQRRLKSNASSTNVQAHEGRQFTFSRRRMPVGEFGRFEIKTVVEFRTKSHGAITVNNVYNYNLKELSSDSPANRPDIMSDLISLETLEGIVIPSEEITDVTVVFKNRP